MRTGCKRPCLTNRTYYLHFLIMFGGMPPPPAKEELEARSAESRGVIATAVYIAAALWAAPFAIELVKGRW